MYQHARAIDASRRREFLQQEKCQQAIGDNSRRDFCQQAKSQQAIDWQWPHENSRTTVLEIFALWRKLDSRMSRMRMFALRT
ncbi:hypothetical protein COS70_05235 [Candidatus Micrarchaeota archaeon CG06_land_8_20_14_3_00_50_6]|nr:MAG: hypothetical protein COS70_05235 [Candidatus Micrarchaeota archaeon CG06_land_8_20_14_3_00_50_6]